jgi:hypothetical protein
MIGFGMNGLFYSKNREISPLNHRRQTSFLLAMMCSDNLDVVIGSKAYIFTEDWSKQFPSVLVPFRWDLDCFITKGSFFVRESSSVCFNIGPKTGEITRRKVVLLLRGELSSNLNSSFKPIKPN